MSHPTKTEVLIRAISEVLAPTVQLLRELGYEAEVVASDDGGRIQLTVDVLVVKK